MKTKIRYYKHDLNVNYHLHSLKIKIYIKGKEKPPLLNFFRKTARDGFIKNRKTNKRYFYISQEITHLIINVFRKETPYVIYHK